MIYIRKNYDTLFVLFIDGTVAESVHIAWRPFIRRPKWNEERIHQVSARRQVNCLLWMIMKVKFSCH